MSIDPWSISIFPASEAADDGSDSRLCLVLEDSLCRGAAEAGHRNTPKEAAEGLEFLSLLFAEGGTTTLHAGVWTEWGGDRWVTLKM